MLALALATMLTFSDAAPPHIWGLKVTVRRNTAGLVIVKGCWTAFGNPDSALTTLTGPAPGSHALPGTARCDTYTLTAPLPDQTIIGTFTVKTKRRRLYSNIISRSWAYTEPDIPPPDPVIDSLPVRPASFTVEATIPGVSPEAKNRQQLCAFVAFRSGSIAFRRMTEGALAYCDSAYRALPAVVQRVSPAEQAMADAVCVKWTATGGTVTPEVCGANPAVRFSPDVKWGVVAVRVTPAVPVPLAQIRRAASRRKRGR